jgi:hypothetical protein
MPRYSALCLALFHYSALSFFFTPLELQYYTVDSSFWTLAFLCTSLSVVSLSALFFWNQLTVWSNGLLKTVTLRRVATYRLGTRGVYSVKMRLALKFKNHILFLTSKISCVSSMWPIWLHWEMLLSEESVLLLSVQLNTVWVCKWL